MASSNHVPNGPKPTMGLLVRLIRGSRESNPANNRRPSSHWELLNLKMRDSTESLAAFEIRPLEYTVHMEVIVGGVPTSPVPGSTGDQPAAVPPVVVVERWKISVGANGDDAGTLAANRVFVHALMGYLKVSEFYADVLSRGDVRCRLKPQGEPHTAPATETMWEKRHFTVTTDGEDAGLEAVCHYNKLWRRELSDVDRGSSSKSRAEAVSPGTETVSTDPSDHRLPPASVPIRSEGSTPAASGERLPVSSSHPMVPPIKGIGHQRGGSGSGMTQSPPLGPTDPSAPVPVVGSQGSGKQSQYTTPPFHPSSLGAPSSLYGTSPSQHNALFDPIQLPSSAMPITIGSNPQQQPTLCGSAPGSHPQYGSGLAQAEIPQMVPLVQEDTNVSSPLVAKRGSGDNFLAMFTDHDTDNATDINLRGSALGGPVSSGGPAPQDDGAQFGEVQDFLAAANECTFSAPVVNVHDYLQSVLGTPRDA